ncbi:Fc.00g064630.m01.CDS01 [Cosmosporella sp. VM-42]
MVSELRKSDLMMIPRKPVASTRSRLVDYLSENRAADGRQGLLSPTNLPRAHGTSSSEEQEEFRIEPPSADAPSSINPGRAVQGWGLEVVATITSTTALIGLLILLACSDGKPLATWTAPLSLNTMVSILTLAIRTPLAFVVGACLAQGKWTWFSRRQGPLSTFIAIEEAGRGPLGSLTLLWELRLRHWVSFGAVVTLALLVIDPFLQGVIMYQGEISTTSNGTASIVRAAKLDIGDWGVEDTGLVIKYRNNTKAADCYYMFPDMSMSATTQIGFVNTSTARIAELPYMTCQTGNCTWPTYSTVGICNSCTDISEHLSKKGTISMNSRCANPFIFDPDEQDFTIYEIPYGRDIARLAYPASNSYANLSDTCSRLEIASTVLPKDTYSFQHWNTLLASYAMVHASDEYWKNEPLWANTSIKATECALRYCIQIHRTTVRNGKIDQTVYPPYFERMVESWQPLWHFNSLEHEEPPVSEEDLETDFGNSLARLNETECALIRRSDLQLRLKVPEDLDLPTDIQHVFNITQKSISTMISDMGPTMAQSIKKAMSNTANVTATFENVARLMTNRMREIDATSVQGTAQHWVIYIRVRWGFIAAPISISLAGITFALVIVWDSRRIPLRTLKSDPLNLLLHGLDNETRNQLRAGNRKEKEVSKMIVGLEKGEDGLELKLCSNSCELKS